VKTHQQEHTPGNESDFMHTFLERVNDDQDQNPNFKGEEGNLNLKNVVVDLFVAGAETTSSSLLWFILLLATFPDIQEKIHQEIDAHVPADETPSLEHRSKLNYTEAAIRDSMRFTSLTPFGLFHSATEDTSMFYQT